MDKTTKRTDIDWWVYLAASLYLVITAFYKGLFPGPREWPQVNSVLVTVGFEVLFAFALLKLRVQLKSKLPQQDGRRDYLDTLFWAGLLAFVALLLFRLVNDAAWFTGHLRPFSE